MSTRDLIELAALDALGMLEPDDQAAFERAFLDAPASVRSQVRAEQARIADLYQNLPGQEPSPDLRDRVIAAVRGAVEVEAAGGPRAVVHRPGRFVPKVVQTRRVSPLWRAAAIGLSVAVVVLGVISNQLQQKNQQLGDQVFISDSFNSVGTRHLRDTLFNSRTERVIFEVSEAAAAQNLRAEAVVLSNPDWKTSRFICQGLTANNGQRGRFILAVVDEANQVLESLKNFDAEGRWVSFDVAVPAQQNVRLAVFIDDGTGQVGQPLMVAQFLA